MVLQGTKLSFDLEILLDVSAYYTNKSQEKLPLYIQEVKKSRVGISFALPHAEVERCL